MYNVTPCTLGSSNDSMTNVSLKINPDPEMLAMTRLPSACAIDGDVRIKADVRTVAAIVFAIGDKMFWINLLLLLGVIVVGRGLIVLVFLTWKG